MPRRKITGVARENENPRETEDGKKGAKATPRDTRCAICQDEARQERGLLDCVSVVRDNVWAFLLLLRLDGCVLLMQLFGSLCALRS